MKVIARKLKKSNYAFKPTAEQALRSIQSAARRRLNAALGVQMKYWPVRGLFWNFSGPVPILSWVLFGICIVMARDVHEMEEMGLLLRRLSEIIRFVLMPASFGLVIGSGLIGLCVIPIGLRRVLLDENERSYLHVCLLSICIINVVLVWKMVNILL